MTLAEVMSELEMYGNDQTKSTLGKHGAKEPFFGVKVEDLKKILKKTKKNHALSLELFATGNSDAMYLAGLMADEKQISKAELNTWVKGAYWHYISEYAVPWVASETPYGLELGLEWIESDIETTAAAGWSTLANWVAIKPDEALDLEVFEKLLNAVPLAIQSAPNRVKYAMNAFVIAVGAYVIPLKEKAKEVAKKLGHVKVDMKGTACKVPLAIDYISKIESRGNVGNKKKVARC